ncbi:MAG: S46 family peptidase [Bacteroidales bacterium]|nr:S46 family peptidase [Bacteroidales bacterium]
MKRLVLLLSGLFLLNSMTIKADEGMWILSLLGKNYEQMKKQGLKLTAEDIYNVNKGCLKDAIVGLGEDGNPFWHFCTGEIISNQGLMSTNHHCGYGKLQEHSTVEHDYLQDGFWAYSKDQELPNPGLTVSILVRIEDVTAEVTKGVNDDMTEADRNKLISKQGKELAKKATEGTDYDAYVATMFNNNQYFLFVYIIYKDVRLVGAPPSSMGKFGGDTDNWMWPRHTCDFSMFRIYTGPDGKPAKYAKENIPLKPKHYLPVSIKGVEDGDYAMIMGFPGTTDRFLTSYGLDETMNITNKLRYEIRTVKINVLREEMASSQKINIQYASKYASCSNYWKYSNEQNKALKNLNTMAIKKDIENNYMQWANKQSNPQYAEALKYIKEGYEGRKPYMSARTYILEGIISGPELLWQAVQNLAYVEALQSADEGRIKASVDAMKESADAFYKDYNPATEKKVMAALLRYTYDNMDETYYPEVFNTIKKKYKGNVEKFVNDVFAKSIFATAEKFNAFLEKPNAKVLENDIALQAGLSAYKKYVEISQAMNQASPNLNKGKRLFVNGLLQINGDKAISPDANSTIRLTYGNVGSYEPRDGVSYSYYTTLKGVMQKENPNDMEFVVPQRLKDLYAAKDYGQYANKDGELVTCFITNNDITGGNSGSPVINAKGELIGLAFDGNSEAMSGDIDFEENLQRCINLDVRYMLFVIDKYAGATNLIQEMDIRK